MEQKIGPIPEKLQFTELNIKIEPEDMGCWLDEESTYTDEEDVGQGHLDPMENAEQNARPLKEKFQLNKEPEDMSCWLKDESNCTDEEDVGQGHLDPMGNTDVLVATEAIKEETEFVVKNDLHLEDDSEHSEGKSRYFCEYCDSQFAIHLNWLKHVTYVHQKPIYMQKSQSSREKPYQCKTCGKYFSMKGNLKAHEIIHSGEKPYHCKTCDKCFNQNGNLKSHERFHAGEKPYQCETCGKYFSTKGNLKAHERIHSGEKPYHCKTCDKCFNHIGNLKSHERFHSEERPYQCKTCDKYFRSKGNLKAHGRIHSGEKPYQCETFILLTNVCVHDNSTWK